MRNARNGGVIHPHWVLPLLGQREKAISEAADVQVNNVDQDGHRLDSHQCIVESKELGESFTVCSKRRMVF